MRAISFASRAYRSFFILTIALISLSASPLTSRAITWNINEVSSFIQLAIPDQNVTIPGLGSVSVGARNQTGSSSSWTAGNKAFIDGTIDTNYNGSSIQFTGGSIFALDSGSYRPDPASWNGSAFSGTGTAGGSYGAKAVAFGFVDAGYLSLRNMTYQLASNSLPIGGGNFAATGVSISSPSFTLQFQGLLGDPLPMVNTNSNLPAQANTAATGTVTTPDPVNQPNLRQLSLPISAPVSLVITGVGTLSGTATGTIIATATVPEPSTYVMGLMGMVGLAVAGWWRKRK